MAVVRTLSARCLWLTHERPELVPFYELSLRLCFLSKFHLVCHGFSLSGHFFSNIAMCFAGIRVEIFLFLFLTFSRILSLVFCLLFLSYFFFSLNSFFFNIFMGCLAMWGEGVCVNSAGVKRVSVFRRQV